MPLRKASAAIRRKIEEAAQELLAQKIPAGAIKDQLRGSTLPPASGTTRGGVMLSDDDPLADGTADPGTSSSASRADHVHPTSGSPSPPYVVALDGTIVLDEDGEPVTA